METYLQPGSTYTDKTYTGTIHRRIKVGIRLRKVTWSGLQIGHTKIMHNCIFQREPPAIYHQCNVSYSVAQKGSLVLRESSLSSLPVLWWAIGYEKSLRGYFRSFLPMIPAGIRPVWAHNLQRHSAQRGPTPKGWVHASPPPLGYAGHLSHIRLVTYFLDFWLACFIPLYQYNLFSYYYTNLSNY